MLTSISRASTQLFSSRLSLRASHRTISTLSMSKSWLPIPATSDFSLQNIPFGIITSRESREQKRPAIAIGDHVLDLLAFSTSNGFSGLPSITKHLDVFAQPTLNAFAALSRDIHQEVREYVQEIFKEDTNYSKVLKDNTELQAKSLLRKEDTKTHLPMQIGDYTDFYAGYNHAFNVGCMFRGPANALQPNYTHLPVGYHGRASSIVVSGTPITRPNGQIILDPTADPKVPTVAPCRRLDIELELGCFLCTPNTAGTPIPIAEAEKHIFGYVLLNDWSARDVQMWEYVPLGPFNSKNFASTVSPWVVLADALEPFRANKLPNSTKLLPYLQESREDTVYDIKLQVDLTSPGYDTATTTISNVSASNLLWSFPQMIAHHSIGGCPMQTGDLLGSGTISGKNEDGKGKDLGSLLEMSENGKKEIMLAAMEVRTFLKDGDEITLRGSCGEDGQKVGFGECRGRIFGAPRLS